MDMDNHDLWKRTDDIEIDLIDLLHSIFIQWKKVLICALVFAAVSGSYGYLKRNVQTRPESVEAENAELTEEEQEAVDNAIQLARETDELKEYLQNSILMQIDPYHKNRTVLLYSIGGASDRNYARITESYLSFLTNGGLLDDLKERNKKMWGTDSRYLAEIITAWQKADAMYRMIRDDSANGTAPETLLYIELTGADLAMVKQLETDIQAVLKDYSRTVKKNCGMHDFIFVSSESSIRIDSSLQAQQNDKKSLLKTNIASLSALTDVFNQKQLDIYENMADIEKQEEEESEEGHTGTGYFVKYILFGAAAGLFLYGILYACWYVLCDSIKSEKEFEMYYTIPLYGSVSLKRADMQNNEMVCAGRQLMERVRLQCRKRAVTHFCFAADGMLNEEEREFLCSAVRQFQEWGIETVMIENVCTDISGWDNAVKAGTILMICRLHNTTRRIIDKEMKFYTENDIQVLGAVAIETKRG